MLIFPDRFRQINIRKANGTEKRLKIFSINLDSITSIILKRTITNREEINRKIIEPRVPLIKYNKPNPKKIRKSLYVFNFKSKKITFSRYNLFSISLSIYSKKFMIKNIRHTGIVTDNLNNSLNFYQKILGFKIKKKMIETGVTIDSVSNLKNVKVETVKLKLGTNKDMIELLFYHSHKRKFSDKNYKISRVGISHFAVTLKNIDKFYYSLKNKIKFISKPRYSIDGNVKMTFCRAPEGTLIELVQELK